MEAGLGGSFTMRWKSGGESENNSLKRVQGREKVSTQKRAEGNKFPADISSFFWIYSLVHQTFLGRSESHCRLRTSLSLLHTHTDPLMNTY